MIKVAVLGASRKPERYAYKAQELLMEKGYEVIPVNPKEREILGIKVVATVPEGVDTVTVYVRADRLQGILDDLIAAAPRRVIFNPGAESPEALRALQKAGVETEEACTLVLLNTGTF